MDKDRTKAAVDEYVETQRMRITQSRNARKWFYRGILTTVAAGMVYAHLANKEDNTEEA